MVIRIPGSVHDQTSQSIVIEVTQEIKSLNQFLPSTKSIERCKNKQIEWKYLADKWTRYKSDWSKALNIVSKMERVKSFSHTTIVSDRSRLIDIENLYGGAKPIRDKFERLGWIFNDSPKWSSLDLTQRKVKKGEEKTWIKIVLDISKS